MEEEDKKKILSELDDEYKELIKRGDELLEEIYEKKKEIEENEDFELDDDDVEEYINETYDDIDLLGVEYGAGTILREVDEVRFNEIGNDEEDFRRNEKEEELNDELSELEDELEDLKVEIEEYSE